MTVPPFHPPLSLHEAQQAFPALALNDTLVAGGQGAVFCGTHEGRPAVVKIFGPDSTKTRVDAEIEKLGRIQSDHLVQLLDHGEVRLRGFPVRCQFCVCDLIEGEDLTHHVGKFDEAQTVRLLRDVGAAIDALWSERVVHRDLKPANIMLRPDGSAVVIDLGFARHLDLSSMTQPGFVVGTLGYMAPEQYAGRRQLTLRADLFALGVVAYEMFSGQHPYMRHQSFIGQPLYDRKPLSHYGASEHLSRVIATMLSTQTRERPKSIAALNQLLP